jgi:ferredoxin
MFGTIIIGNKSKVHARFPTLDKFSAALADIYSASKPQLTVVDGYYCQEGQKGPAAGDVVKLDLIMAGYDPVALDCTACKIIDLDPRKVVHLVKAQQKGLGTMDLTKIAYIGNSPDKVKHPFKLPKAMSVPFPVPDFITAYISKVIMKTDIRFDSIKCTLCRTCIHNCPFGAITPPAEIKKGNTPIWNKSKCQSCYCCVETCPAEAVNFKINIAKNVIKSWLGVGVFAVILCIVLLAVFL